MPHEQAYFTGLGCMKLILLLESQFTLFQTRISLPLLPLQMTTAQLTAVSIRFSIFWLQLLVAVIDFNIAMLAFNIFAPQLNTN